VQNGAKGQVGNFLSKLQEVKGARVTQYCTEQPVEAWFKLFSVCSDTDAILWSNLGQVITKFTQVSCKVSTMQLLQKAFIQRPVTWVSLTHISTYNCPDPSDAQSQLKQNLRNIFTYSLPWPLNPDNALVWNELQQREGLGEPVSGLVKSIQGRARDWQCPG